MKPQYNKARQTPQHFEVYEKLIGCALADRADFRFVSPVPDDGEKRARGSTIAVNINFAMKWFLDNPNVAHSTMFDRASLLDFRSRFVVLADHEDDWTVRVKERKSYASYKKPAFTQAPINPRNEGSRLSSLMLDLDNLELFRAVLRCMKHGVITWPVPFSGTPITIHKEYVAEFENCAEMCAIPSDDTTVLVPNLDE